MSLRAFVFVLVVLVACDDGGSESRPDADLESLPAGEDGGVGRESGSDARWEVMADLVPEMRSDLGAMSEAGLEIGSKQLGEDCAASSECESGFCVPGVPKYTGGPERTACCAFAGCETCNVCDATVCRGVRCMYGTSCKKTCPFSCCK